MPNQVFSINKHIAFLMDDKETQFETVNIVSANPKTLFIVYVKNISDLLLNNLKIAIPKHIKLLDSFVPGELKPNEGFFLEFEADSSLDSDDFIQIQSKPHSISYV